MLKVRNENQVFVVVSLWQAVLIVFVVAGSAGLIGYEAGSYAMMRRSKAALYAQERP